jgi:hypothetical protein
VKPADISGIKRANICKNIIELPTNSKNNNIRDLYKGINEFKRGYQPRYNLVKDENSDLLADFHSIFDRRKNYSSSNDVHDVSDVIRQK